MTKRVCYIQYIPSINGRESLIGRRLFDHLVREFDVDLCDCVLGTDVDEGVYNIRPTDFHAVEFDAVYIEGGLYWPCSTSPKVELDLVKSFVNQGGVAIVADVGRNEATPERDQSPYASARGLFGTAPNWGMSGDKLRYGVDFRNNLNHPGSVIAYPARMVVDPWIEPVYDGIDQLLVLQALALDMGGVSILATGNAGSSEVHAVDTRVDAASPFMFRPGRFSARFCPPTLRRDK